MLELAQRPPQFFRDLQDLHSFAPLRSQNLQIVCNFLRENFRIFFGFLQNFAEFLQNLKISVKNQQTFDANLQTFRD